MGQLFWLPFGLRILLIGILAGVVLFLLAKTIGNRRSGSASARRDREDSLGILRRRLAEGDIDYEEYRRIEEALKRQEKEINEGLSGEP